jgi:hypothetical protein
MLNLFHRSGFPIASTLDQGIYTVTITFPGGADKTPALA